MHELEISAQTPDHGSENLEVDDRQPSHEISVFLEVAFVVEPQQLFDGPLLQHCLSPKESFTV